MNTIKEKQKKTFEALKDKFGYSNSLAAVRIEKVVVNVGTGRMTRSDKGRNEFVAKRLASITGQKSAPRGARKSVSAFSIRQGEPIGHVVTLRGRRMYDFLERLFNTALPRTRDFRGLNRSAVDEMGNLTIGIREHNIFPETSDEDLRDIFGIAVTIVTTTGTREEAIAFFEQIGVPFKAK